MQGAFVLLFAGFIIKLLYNFYYARRRVTGLVRFAKSARIPLRS